MHTPGTTARTLGSHQRSSMSGTIDWLYHRKS